MRKDSGTANYLASDIECGKRMVFPGVTKENNCEWRIDYEKEKYILLRKNI